jgi:hypothetical protein
MMPQSSARILAVLPVAKQNAIVGFLYQQFPGEIYEALTKILMEGSPRAAFSPASDPAFSDSGRPARATAGVAT